MAKVTKKLIREEIRRVRSLRAGHGTYAFGYRMFWTKHMKPPGVPGYAWKQMLHIEKFYTVPGRTDGPFTWNGTVDEAVEALFYKLTRAEAA